MRVLHRGAVPLLLIGSLTSPAASQTPDDVRITKTRTTEFGGVLGVMMRLAPGVDETEREVLSIHGTDPVTRTDIGQTSTVMDFSQGAVTVEDHEDRSWFRYTFEDILAAMESYGTPAAGVEEPEEPAQPAEDADVEYEVSIELDRPGQTKAFQDVQLELVRLIVTATPVRATDIDPNELPSYVLVSDEWLAEDHEAAEAMERIYGAAADQMKDVVENQGAGEALGQAFLMNQALHASYEEMADELSEIQGIPLEATMAFIAVMPGATLDLEAAMGAPLAGPEVDFRKMARERAADAAENAVEGAVRSRLGRVGGLLGRGRDKNEEAEAAGEEEAMPTQAVILRSTERTESIEIGPLEPGWTQPRDGYQEKPAPFARPR